MVWKGGEKKEPWHFFGTPLCPSCPEWGGYHGISGHLIKQTIVGACVCVHVRVCMCHTELHGNNLWTVPARSSTLAVDSARLQRSRNVSFPSTHCAHTLTPVTYTKRNAVSRVTRTGMVPSVFLCSDACKSFTEGGKLRRNMQCMLMEQPAWLENEPALKNNPKAGNRNALFSCLLYSGPLVEKGV